MRRFVCGGILACLTIVGFCVPSVAIGQDRKLKGDIKIDGSSTVFLISKAVAADFRKLYPSVSLNIAFAGTGAGFRKFAAGDIEIQDASRKIKDSEADECKKNGVDYLELQVAWDGIAVVTHKDNNFATKLTLAQMKKIWEPGSKVKTWKDVDPAFPNEPITLWGAGKDSGTFDYFTEAVNGKERAIRQDYNGNEDDNVIVKGVSSDKYAMGFFGVAYYSANKAKLNVVALAKESGKYLEPTEDNVRSRDNPYPISRPLFIYINKKALARDEVREFARFYLANPDIATRVGYVSLTSPETARMKKRLESVK